jgi:adenine C2-methylase RlmN of 23S rRNA A2503 and tRNA A37
MAKLEILNSKIDRSVNFVEEQLVGFLESRFVRKCDDYFICYLSSQTGCNRGCKFCHLTATNQSRYTDSSYYDFLSQATQVFQHYQNQEPARYVHYNFMARGEPLANSYFLSEADRILWSLGELAMHQNLAAKFNVSTIMPVTLKRSLVDTFKVIQPTIYYSLYSVRESFRKEWLPAAMPVQEALTALKNYQDHSKKILKIHFCFIKDQNDSIEDLELICEALEEYKLQVEFNLVRYNPASPEQGEESSGAVIASNMAFLKKNLNGKVQVIERVGFDIKASCGCFVESLDG